MAERRRPTAGGRSETGALRFVGPPRRLRLWQASGGGEPALRQAGPAMPAMSALHLPDALSAHADPHHAVLRRGAERARTRLRLAADTPPGDYKATVELADGQTQAVSVCVQPHRRLHVTPASLQFAGAVGGRATAELLVENRGNVPLTIEVNWVTGVFADTGIETALASAYRLKSNDLDEIVGTVFGRLREAHGGLFKLRVVEGAGPLAVGERRVLRVEARLGERLHPGRGYHGVVDVCGNALSVRITMAPAHSGGQP